MPRRTQAGCCWADGTVGRVRGAFPPGDSATPAVFSSQQGGEMVPSPHPHSTPFPVGTTAEPGLIPDLVARIPCELRDPGGVQGCPAGRRGRVVHRDIRAHLRTRPRAPVGARSRCCRRRRPLGLLPPLCPLLPPAPQEEVPGGRDRGPAQCPRHHLHPPGEQRAAALPMAGTRLVSPRLELTVQPRARGGSAWSGASSAQGRGGSEQGDRETGTGRGLSLAPWGPQHVLEEGGGASSGLGADPSVLAGLGPEPRA